MSDDFRDDAVEAEAAGETVGEAKWTALRQLEQRVPGLDRSQVEFVVLSEGERGLLGVGFVPARVIARVEGPAARGQEASSAAEVGSPAAALQGSLSPAGEQLRDVLERLRDALGLDASVSVSETGSELAGTFHGRDLGLAIGKHGQTIDAIQTIAGMAVARAAGEGSRPDVIVDAAGYRDRRRAFLEQLADRAASRAEATGGAVELEPMGAAERKIVHLWLRDHPGVTTSSEGADPNRHVVVRPAE
jgi:spoIIIJ-associated protein